MNERDAYRLKLNRISTSDLLDVMDGLGSAYDYDDEDEHNDPSKYDSRALIARRICKALEGCDVCTICGNGATSLAKKVKKELLFTRIAMVTVSHNPNLQEIKYDILQQLKQLWIGDCLLILGGLWWELSDKDFRKIGIPSPSKRFKIVYTSRNEDMCPKIGSSCVFHVNFFEDEEAWDLFREKSAMGFHFHQTARQIVDECDGFRIPILTIASTLKDKPLHVWKNSLIRLQNSNRSHISDKEKVFSMIHLSYDLLNDKEAQLLFLLCCLFPEDFNIPVENLVLLGKGLQLFDNVDSMRQARDRVEGIIHQLKNSYLLLDGDGNDFIKMNDMCRDFGVVEMSSKLKYVVRCADHIEEWPPDIKEYQNWGAISFMCKTIKKHPVYFECPNLHLLQLSYGSDSARLPTGLFVGLKNLQVLTLSIPSLSHSLTMLKKLRTLCITETVSDNRYKKPRPRIGDLLSEEMKDLEIFSFSTARPYDDFPREIGKLHNLRFLRFNRERLKYIPPGILSKLVKLEELYLPLDFISWGCKEEGGERMNASLSEIESLVQLTAARISVQKGSILTKKFVKKLTRFHVFIGSHVSPEYEFLTGGNSKKVLEIFDVDAGDFRVSWISGLVWKSESLRLKQVRNLKNFITWKPKKGKNIESPQWKKIRISDCKEVESLAAGQIPWSSFSQLESLKLFGLGNLEEIYLSKIDGSWFGNLCEIQIMFCKKLKYVFSVSVATEMRKLQSLEICFCDEMEAIFHLDGNKVESGIQHKSKLMYLTSKSIMKGLIGRGKQPETVTSRPQIGKEDEQNVAKDEIIIFPQLKTVELAYMDKLRVFYAGNHHAILMPSLQSLSVFQCNHLEAFCHGFLRTPLLQQLLINGNPYSAKGDLNATVKII